MRFVFGLISLIAIISCSTVNSPYQIQSDIQITEQNLKETSFGPFTDEQALEFIKDRKQSIEELLEPKIDPYKGEDSTPSICQFKNLPESVSKSGEGWFYQELFFYSSQNMILGLCPNSKELLKTRYRMLYCEKEQKVYVLQFFYDANLSWAIKFETKCR